MKQATRAIAAAIVCFLVSNVSGQTLNMDSTPANVEPTLSQINESSEVYAELLTRGQVSAFDGIRYHHDLQQSFFINTELVESGADPRYRVMQNFFVEGNSSATDVFTISALQVNPTTPNPNTTTYEYYLDSLNLDNVHLQVIDFGGGTFDAQPELIIRNAINLNSASLTIGAQRRLSFFGDHSINVSGQGNTIVVDSFAWNESQTRSTALNLAAGSDLTVENFSEILNRFRGRLDMASGSRLRIQNSEVVLVSDVSEPGFLPSVINGATVEILGSYVGASGSSLQLTDPFLTNASIIVGDNNEFRAFRTLVSNGSITPGLVTFEGQNMIQLGNGSTFSGQSGTASPTTSFGTFVFRNGTTTVQGDTNAVFQASDWLIDNATLSLASVAAEEFVSNLTIDNSTFNDRGIPFDALDTLTVRNSTLGGFANYGNATATAWIMNSSTIDPGLGTQAGGSAQYAAGKTFDFGQAVWLGNNTFISNIDPNGTEIAVGSGIRSYANELIIERAAVTGFESLEIVLNSVDASLAPSAYENGGPLGDGVFDLIQLRNGATADGDNPTITLGQNMPALLTATQVATPSADNRVSVRFQSTGFAGLSMHPSIQTGNQQSAAALLGAGANGGNATLQNALNSLLNGQVASHLNTFHPEPYSSYMTVGLEQADLTVNSVLDRFGWGREGTLLNATSVLWLVIASTGFPRDSPMAMLMARRTSATLTIRSSVLLSVVIYLSQQETPLAFSRILDSNGWMSMIWQFKTLRGSSMD